MRMISMRGTPWSASLETPHPLAFMPHHYSTVNPHILPRWVTRYQIGKLVGCEDGSICVILPVEPLRPLGDEPALHWTCRQMVAQRTRPGLPLGTLLRTSRKQRASTPSLPNHQPMECGPSRWGGCIERDEVRPRKSSDVKTALDHLCTRHRPG